MAPANSDGNIADVSGSPRLAWVRENAERLLVVAEEHGALRMCLCGSVARGDDRPDSDIDLYAWEFCKGDAARERAESLVRTIRAMCPFDVDVRAHGMPGWPLDRPFETTMQQDAVDLASLAFRERP